MKTDHVFKNEFIIDAEGNSQAIPLCCCTRYQLCLWCGSSHQQNQRKVK